MGVLGEAGTYTNNFSPENVEREVLFDRNIENPVIHLTGTNNGGDPYIFRITEIRPDGFKFILEEWEYRDGPHGATETIHWIAVKAGEHRLADGRLIKAGYADSDATSGGVTFDNAFTGSPPVVLTTTASNNDLIAADSDPLSITTSGFQIRMQEEEAQANDHGIESVGWIAIEPGTGGANGTAQTFGGFNGSNSTYDLGADFVDPIIGAETQTINDAEAANIEIRGLDAGTDEVTLRLREEQSLDNERNHGDETLGLVAFERGIMFCFTPGTQIDTPDGPCDVASLRSGQRVNIYGGGHDRILWICRRALGVDELRANPKLYPVKITKGALGNNRPTRDLSVSRQHRLLVNSKIALRVTGTPEVLVAAHKLTDLPGIYVDYSVESVDYIHLMLSRHEVIFANGAMAETLYLGTQTRSAMTSAALREIHQIFPKLSSAGRPPTPRFPIPTPQKQNRIIYRHLRNGRPL